MGKFDGWLICTDWDGTLFWDGQIPEENIRAIRDFQKNGGLFTVCSGRYPDFLRRYAEQIHPNTYAITLNGALILDLDTNEVLYEGFSDEEMFDRIDEIFAAGAPYRTVNLYPCGTSDISENNHYTKEEFFAKEKILRQRRYYKALLFTPDEEEGKRALAIRNAGLHSVNYELVRSWDRSLEIVRRCNNKAAGTHRVKEATGARHLVTVGDYENDISMLDAADLSYAVANADPSVKPHAKRLTVHAKDGAIAAVIADIEKNFLT